MRKKEYKHNRMNLRDAVKPLHVHICVSLAPSLGINRSAIIQYFGCTQLFSLKKIKIYETHIRYISKIYKDYLKLNNKKTT